MLERFWSNVSRFERVITYNGRGFDVPFLMQRSLIREVEISTNLLPPRFFLDREPPRSAGCAVRVPRDPAVRARRLDPGDRRLEPEGRLGGRRRGRRSLPRRPHRRDRRVLRARRRRDRETGRADPALLAPVHLHRGEAVTAVQDHYPEAFAQCYGCGRLNEDGLKHPHRARWRHLVCRFTPRPEHRR